MTPDHFTFQAQIAHFDRVRASAKQAGREEVYAELTGVVYALHKLREVYEADEHRRPTRPDWPAIEIDVTVEEG
jgi:hypothetical protein